jgi:3-deoxy-manno-octulosonate cytidylyltransferase (CMP-KDO synthetase)
MKIVAMIPARMGSSRFPGKPLAKIHGKPMIEHVYRGTAACKKLAAVYIATCDKEIADAAKAFGAPVAMTSDKHERATDRIAEAAQTISADVYVMVQGDEPMITPDMIDLAVEPILKDPKVVCVNLAAPIKTEADFKDRNTIKVVLDKNNDAICFSREPIPHRSLKDARKQVCIIPFRRDFLLTFTKLAPTPLEIAESIDMMRALEHGYKVRMVPGDFASQAVDTPEDLKRVEALLK